MFVGKGMGGASVVREGVGVYLDAGVLLFVAHVAVIVVLLLVRGLRAWVCGPWFDGS
jgi:hypothetical protein